MVDQKSTTIETADQVIARAERAVEMFGADRVFLNPDCGFATFADNPISSAKVAEGKLRAMAEASQELRRRHFGAST